MRIIVIIFVLIFLISCGKSALEMGKSELKNGNYSTALEFLEEAKIDQPLNEEIDQLIKMAKSKIADAEFRTKLENYLANIFPKALELKSIFEDTDFDNVTMEDITSANAKSKEILIALKEAKLEGEFELFGNPNSYLKFSIEAFETILKEGKDKVLYQQESKTTSEDGQAVNLADSLQFLSYYEALSSFGENIDSYIGIIDRLKQRHGL